MKKKIIAIMAAVVCLCSLSGCSSTYDTFIENVPLIRIRSCLYYDSTTRIVYIWNGHINDQFATVPTPYYAPNGLPYKYNPSTNTFEVIK